MPTIPYEVQLREVRREIAMRRRVYAGQVENRRMTQAEADHKIAVMEAVAETLVPLAKAEERPL